MACGLIAIGTCNSDVTSVILQTMMERSAIELKDHYARFLALGLGLVYLGRYYNVYMKCICIYVYATRGIVSFICFSVILLVLVYLVPLCLVIIYLGFTLIYTPSISHLSAEDWTGTS